MISSSLTSYKIKDVEFHSLIPAFPSLQCDQVLIFTNMSILHNKDPKDQVQHHKKFLISHQNNLLSLNKTNRE